MPGIYLTTGNKYSTSGKEYRVNIIDYTLTEDANLPMKFSSEELEYTDEDQNLFCPIGAKKYTFDVFKTTTTKQFIEDLVEHGEGRYYVEVLQNPSTDSKRLFLGRVIINDSEIGDNRGDKITIIAIDGLTLLKSIDFDWYYQPGYDNTVYENAVLTFVGSIKNIILSILKRIDVIDKFFTDTDVIAQWCTNIELAEEWSNGQDPLAKLAHFDYWTKYKISNTNGIEVVEPYKKTHRSCYDVLEDILKRYNLRIEVIYDRYVIRGWNNIYLDDYHHWIVYRKNGTEILGTDINREYYDLTPGIANENSMLDAGRHTLTGGMKKVSFKRDKEFIDTENELEDEIPREEEVFGGTLIKDEQYYLTLRQYHWHETIYTNKFLVLDIQIRLEIGGTSTYLNFEDDITYMFSEAVTTNVPNYTEQSGAVYNRVVCDTWYPAPKSTPDVIKIKLPIKTSNAELYIRVNKVGYIDIDQQTTTWSGAEKLFTIAQLDSGKTDKDGYELISIINNTNNYNEYTQNVIASDTYASERTQSYIIDEALDNLGHSIGFNKPKFKTDNNFKIKGQPLNYVADVAVLKEMLKIATPVKRMFLGQFRGRSIDITPLDILTFHDKEYIVRSLKHNIFDDFFTVSLHEIGVATVTEVEPDDETPQPPPVPETQLAGTKPGVFESGKPKYFQFLNVTNNYVTVNYKLPVKTGQDRLLIGDQNSIRVYYNGVRWYQIHQDADFTAGLDQYKIENLGATFKVNFNRTGLRGGRVQVELWNFFEFGTTT